MTTSDATNDHEVDIMKTDESQWIWENSIYTISIFESMVNTSLRKRGIKPQ